MKHFSRKYEATFQILENWKYYSNIQFYCELNIRNMNYWNRGTILCKYRMYHFWVLQWIWKNAYKIYSCILVNHSTFTRLLLKIERNTSTLETLHGFAFCHDIYPVFLYTYWHILLSMIFELWKLKVLILMKICLPCLFA